MGGSLPLMGNYMAYQWELPLKRSMERAFTTLRLQQDCCIVVLKEDNEGRMGVHELRF